MNTLGDTATAQQTLNLIIDALADAVAARISDKMQQPQKTAYTVEEVAERYSVSKDSVRRWAANGDFGPLLHVSERVHLITAEGIRQFEASRTGPTRRGPAAPQCKRKARRADPGPI